MDGTPAFPQPSRAGAPKPAAEAPAVVAKTPSDYFRAVRRRAWLVLMVGAPLAVAAVVFAVRQPSVYRVEAQIQIVPPQYDPVLSTLVSHEVGRSDPDATERYLPNRINQLKSPYLAQAVLNQPEFLVGSVPVDLDAARELIANMTVKPALNSNWVTVTLDGTDPARTAKLLHALLDRFRRDAQEESERDVEASKDHASRSLDKLIKERAAVEERLGAMLAKASFIGPDGKNMIQAQLETMGATLMEKRHRYDEFRQQSWVAQLVPRPPAFGPEQTQIAQLHERRHKAQLQLEEARRVTRQTAWATDPTVKAFTIRLERLLQQIEQLSQVPADREPATNASEMMTASLAEEVKAAEEATQGLMAQLRASVPDHQKYLTLTDERESILKRVYDMQTKLSEFETLASSQRKPVTIPAFLDPPTDPVRPKRAVNVALGLFLSFGLGVALVCLLESLDRSVKEPEQLTAGLTLPLLGVVPRIRRTAPVTRGGHLWTPGLPDSLEADAYRNVRASLLGASDRLGPIVTLLVTSAKAGEGKSTTALNLAATCARAGERTLLMDVDLRRPSLADVFPGPDDDRADTGLVDVLRGALPWQRTVLHTDIPNLDFLGTGDTRDVPVEVLGTLELRQLLIGLASHYDRVVLDGPAVLGLADCRVLGRVVDAALLVVRAGAHELRPLQRAKVMLEQSRVVLAGLVFNGIDEDVQNWSSYGPSGHFDALSYSRGTARDGRLEAPDREGAQALAAGALV